MGEGGTPRIQNFPKKERAPNPPVCKTDIFVEDFHNRQPIKKRAIKNKAAARKARLFLRRFPEYDLVDAVNPHADQLIDAEVVNSPRAHVADVFRCHIVNAWQSVRPDQDANIPALAASE